ncbi:MAG: NAD(P)/FAD-dependent oxidoreductase [Thermoanaerobaculia bacterium]|nr:NAD(P)/FAD-dependent oxidoreductase [Thermoanaerobaculia bacterium]
MKDRVKYDAIVVGARVAGAATAMLLARKGMKVLAVDRARYGSDTLSTHALMRTAVVQLNRWGLLDRVKASGATPVTRVDFHYPDETVPVDLAPAGGLGALYAPRRTVLDRILVDAAREAGAEVRFGIVVDDLRRGSSHRVTGISARDEQGERLELDAGIVVGADGIRSIVAQSAGAKLRRRAKNSGAVVYGYFAGVAAEGYEWAYAPGLSAGLIPTNDGQVCVFVGGAEDSFRHRVFSNLEIGFAGVLEAASPGIAERVARGELVSRYRGFAGVHGYIRESVGAGWALAGDAGYFRDPITTHGISDAFRDAELLARAIAGEMSLGDFQETRDSVIEPVFDVTDRIAGYDWTMEEIRGYLREMSRAVKPEMKLIAGFDQPAAA